MWIIQDGDLTLFRFISFGNWIDLLLKGIQFKQKNKIKQKKQKKTNKKPSCDIYPISSLHNNNSKDFIGKNESNVSM